MLTFNPKFKFLIYLATTIASTYIGLQLTEALCIESCNLDKLLYIVFSNIVFLSFEKEKNADMFVDNLKDKGVRLATITPKVVRIVTHLDINEEDLVRFISILEKL